MVKALVVSSLFCTINCSISGIVSCLELIERMPFLRYLAQVLAGHFLYEVAQALAVLVLGHDLWVMAYLEVQDDNV